MEIAQSSTTGNKAISAEEILLYDQRTNLIDDSISFGGLGIGKCHQVSDQVDLFDSDESGLAAT